MALMKEEYQGISTILVHDFTNDSNCCRHYPVLMLECNSLDESSAWKFELIKCILILYSYKILCIGNLPSFLPVIFLCMGKIQPPFKLLFVQKSIPIPPH